MSTLKVNNFQVGQDSTATNNLTWFQPGTPDGTIRLGSGNAGSATSKFTFDKDGNLTCVGTITATSVEATIDDWIVHDGDTNTKFGFPAADQFQVLTSGNERITIDSNGKLLIGEITTPFSTTGYRKVQIGQADGGWVNLARTGVPADGNHLGALQAFAKGADGTYHPTVGIDYKADGTPSNTSKPSRIEFYTTAGSSTTKTERLRITSTGHLGVGDNNPDTRLSVTAASGTDVVAKFTSTDANAWIQFRDNSTTDTGVMIGASGDNMMLRAGSNERLRITSAGDLSLRTTTQNAYLGLTANSTAINLTLGSTSGVTIAKLANSATVPNLVFGVSRGTSPGTAITSGDRLGYISFTGDDGTDIHTVGAAIVAGTDAAPSSNSISGTLRFYTGGNQTSNERLHITSGGNVNIGGNLTQTTYTMRVTGSFAATTKSFVIDHPTKENHKLRYACLEGPENSVYVRGRSSDPVIELPDYWVGLVHDDSITVNVTPIGNKKVWVESINNNSVTIGSDDSTEYFYAVFAERKDVEKLEVEVEN